MKHDPGPLVSASSILDERAYRILKMWAQDDMSMQDIACIEDMCRQTVSKIIKESCILLKSRKNLVLD